MRYIYIFIFCIKLFSGSAVAQIKLTFTVKQSPPLQVDAGDDTRIEKGDSVQLGGEPVSGGKEPYTYSWTPTRGLSRNDVPNPIATPDSTTTYTLLVKDEAGCSKTATITVNINTVTGLIVHK